MAYEFDNTTPGSPYRLFLKEGINPCGLNDAPVLDKNLDVIGFVTILEQTNPQSEAYLYNLIVKIIDLNGIEKELAINSDSLETVEEKIRDTLKEMQDDFEQTLQADNFIFRPILAEEKLIKPGTFKIIDHNGDEIGRVEINSFGEKGGGLKNEHVITVILPTGNTATFKISGHDRTALNQYIQSILTN